MAVVDLDWDIAVRNEEVVIDLSSEFGGKGAESRYWGGQRHL